MGSHVQTLAYSTLKQTNTTLLARIGAKFAEINEAGPAKREPCHPVFVYLVRPST